MFRVMLPLLAMLSGGCVECTLDLRPSVRLTVVDESGDPVEGASVECSVDGEDLASPGTTNEDGMSGCGQEQDGDFEIEVSKEGYRSETLDFSVDADQCHVITETREVTLVALPTTGG